MIIATVLKKVVGNAVRCTHFFTYYVLNSGGWFGVNRDENEIEDEE
jgi:hypothetical protein